VELDALDRGILELLRRDARQSMRSLARQLRTTTPTVSARIRALEANGFLLGYRADVPDSVLGGRTVWALLHVAPAAAQAVAEAIGERSWVEEVHTLAGGRMLARLRLHDDGATMADVDALLSTLPGVASYEAHEAVAVRHAGGHAISDKAIRPRCHQCGRTIAGEALRATLGGRRHVFCCVVCRDTFKARFRKAVDAA